MDPRSSASKGEAHAGWPLADRESGHSWPTAVHARIAHGRGKWGLAHGPDLGSRAGKIEEGRVPVHLFRAHRECEPL
jgi:hypothetical protein